MHDRGAFQIAPTDIRQPVDRVNTAKKDSITIAFAKAGISCSSFCVTLTPAVAISKRKGCGGGGPDDPAKWHQSDGFGANQQSTRSLQGLSTAHR